jgi:hypothetical protein
MWMAHARFLSPCPPEGCGLNTLYGRGLPAWTGRTGFRSKPDETGVKLAQTGSKLNKTQSKLTETESKLAETDPKPAKTATACKGPQP